MSRGPRRRDERTDRTTGAAVAPAGPAPESRRDGSLPRRRDPAVPGGCRLQNDATVESEPMGELAELARTAGVDVVGRVMQRRARLTPAMLFGKGKVEEIAALAATTGAEVVITENDLSPAQIRNLEEVTRRRVVDRTELILDIFALGARSAQARAQVELAQLQYLLPRLRRMWTHLERFEGGVGMRGPGETQLETDRRMVRHRITGLRADLTGVGARRQREVSARADAFTVSIVGYTNAGKSTLMNRCTGADVYVADQLFATLDTRSRTWDLPGSGHAVLSDTVGFIRRLPHQLVASFQATLAEAVDADLLLHVADASHPDVAGQIATVEAVLGEIGASARPRLLVLNKIDRLTAHLPLAAVRSRYPDRIELSALTGVGCDALVARVAKEAARDMIETDIIVPWTEGARLAKLRAAGAILTEESGETGVRLHVRLRKGDAGLLGGLAARPG